MKAQLLAWSVSMLGLLTHGLFAQDYFLEAPYSVNGGAGSQPSGFALAGDRAYVVDWVQGLVILDITRPTRPEVIGQYALTGEFAPVAVAVLGQTACVLDSYQGFTRLVTFDVTDPVNPVPLGSLGDSEPPVYLGSAQSLSLVGNRCYVIDYNTISVVDIANASAPLWLGQFTSQDYTIMDLAVSGNMLYVAGGYEGGLRILNASDPTHITEAGQLLLESEPVEGVEVEGSTAFINAYGYLRRVDVSNPATPSVLDELVVDAGSIPSTLIDGFVYLPRGDGSIRIVDYTDPVQPADLGSFLLLAGSNASPSPLQAEGTRLAYLDYEAGLVLGDLSTLSQPRFAGNFSQLVAGLGYASSPDHGFLVDGLGGITVLDQTTEYPYQAGFLDLPGYAMDVVRLGDYAYVAAGFAGLHVVDVTEAYNPTKLGTVNTPGSAKSVALENDRLIVAAGDAGLLIYGVADPANPSLLGTFTTLGSAASVTAVANLAYVSLGEAGVQIVDITNPAQCVLKATLPTQGTAVRTVLNGNEVYVLLGRDGIQVFNVSNPTSPQLLRRLGFDGPVSDILVLDGLLLVGLPQSGAVLLDLGNPDGIRPVAKMEYPQGLLRLYASGRAIAGAGHQNFQATLHVISYAQNPTLQSVSTWPGVRAAIPQKVKGSGDLLCVTADAATGILAIYDISTRSRPRLITAVPAPEYDPFQDLEMMGSLVFVTTRNGSLHIIDLSTPTMPFTLAVAKGGSSSESGIHRIELADGFAYIADESEGFAIYDVQDPTRPQYIAQYHPLTGGGGPVAVKGNVGYAGSLGEHLDIVDLTDRSSPTLILRADPGVGYAWDMEIDQDLLAIATASTTLFDVSNPMAPLPLGQLYAFPQRTSDMHVHGGRVYLADALEGLVLLDISNPALPSLASTNAAGLAGASGVHAVETQAYVLDQLGLHVYDVTDATQPVPGAVLPLFVRLDRLDVENNLVFGAGGSFRQFTVLDLSNPAIPEPIYSGELFQSEVLDVDAVGNRVYVANESGGLAILDVSNPSQPVELGRFGGINARGVQVVGHLAYVAAADQGLKIVDVSVPSAPVLRGGLNTGANTYGVWVNGSRAYLLEGYEGLKIVDVTSPANPTLLGGYVSFNGTTDAVVIQGDLAYVGAGNTIVVVNLSDPANPQELNTLYANDSIRSLQIKDGFLWASLGQDDAFFPEGYVLRYDLSQDPTQPAEAGRYRLPAGGLDLFLQSDSIIVALGQSGMQILKLSVATPMISITRQGSQIELSWPSEFPGYQLESAGQLPASQWQTVPGGDTSPVQVPIGAEPLQVFRLRSP